MEPSSWVEPARERVIRAVVESYDATTHRVDVRPTSAPAALWQGLPAAGHCPGELLRPGAVVAVLLWPDMEGLVLGPYGGREPWPLSAAAAHQATVYFTNTPDHSPLAALTLTLAVHEPSYFVVLGGASVACNTVASTASIMSSWIDGELQMPVALMGTTVANYYTPAAIAYRSVGVYAPGEHTLELRFRSTYTITVRYSAHSAVAIPAPAH